MRRLFLKLVLAAAPFGLYALAVIAVDPFDYFRPSPVEERLLKASIAGKLDPPLFKLLAYRRSPRAHILLGDSRMYSLGEELIAARIGAPVANLAYGGGSLKEAIRTFWIAADATELKSVTIGVNLDTYNDSNSKDRVGPAEAMLHNPALYVSSRPVALAMGYMTRQALGGAAAEIGRPPMSPEEFWRYQLEVTAKLFYGGYRDPATYSAELKRVAEECARRGIKLRFVIFPEHDDLVACATRSGLDVAAERMRDGLKRIAPTIDFASRKDWTADRDLFVDPFHFAPPVAAEIVDRVWGEEPN